MKGISARRGKFVWTGQGISLAIHALVIVFGGAFFVEKAEYGIEVGRGGSAGSSEPVEYIAEVELEPEPEAVTQPDTEPEPEPPVEPEPEPVIEPSPEAVLEEAPDRVAENVVEEVLPREPEAKPQPKPKAAHPPAPANPSQATAKTKSSNPPSRGTGGAYVSAKPNYLRNPAPAYPRRSVAQGHEGTVYLRVYLSERGTVERLTLARGSGHAELDRAAIRAVRRWRFKPERRGGIPVRSVVSVPVVFRLD